MKIYVVTSGCYSDYHIEAIFTDYKKAINYANFNSERNVETYETKSKFSFPKYIRVNYVPGKNFICHIKNTYYVVEDYIYTDQFSFVAVLSERLIKDIKKNGVKSPLLLKIAQDRWAQYKAEHAEKTDEEENEPTTITTKQAAEAFKKFTALFNANFSKKTEEKHEN